MAKDINKIIQKDYGDVIMSGSFLKQRDRYVYSLGPMLDYGLNGGIPEGSVSIFGGDQGSGKTTCALFIAHQFLKRGKNVYYQDIEHRLEKKHMHSIKGFDAEALNFIRSTEERILESEDFLEIGLHLARDKQNKGGLLVVDSIDALIPKNIQESGEVSGTRRAPNARIMSDFLRQMAPLCCVNNFTIILIAHTYANVSGYGGPAIGGGTYAKFQSGTIIACRSKPKPTVEDGKQVGQVVSWEIMKSDLGSPPADKVDSYIRYGYGIDEITEIIQMINIRGLDHLIEKSGAWYNLNFLDEPLKLQGMSKCFQYFDSNPEQFDKLKQMYREASL